VKFPRLRRSLFKRAAAVLAVLLLILFLFRPGVDELRNRIAGSIGSALGRQVALDNVRLRVLPQPGFDLEGLVIYDDPDFSAEPMIRAQEVSAVIRLRSLLRGRLEIATLSATEPSINLVRNSAGRWNLATLLERNAQIPAARTEKPASERRPAFPYLEASNARVNFKIEQTKKSYALMNADVALWQDSDNSWSARIKAEPVRTDFNLTDTGLLQINATWQRAESLRSTPMQIAVEWQKGQLGQITKLLSGKDRGWRGGLSFTATMTGTPEALQIVSRTAIEDFHRYDIVDADNVHLAADCLGQFNAITSTISDSQCDSPIGAGTFHLGGNVALVARVPTYDLTLQVRNIPLTSVVRLLRQSKKQIPGDLVASGSLNGEFHATSNSAHVRTTRHDAFDKWIGSGSASNVRISSQSGKNEVAFGTIPLLLLDSNSKTNQNIDSIRGDRIQAQIQIKDQEPNAPHLRIGPVALATNGSAPVAAGGWISGAGYRFFLRGDVELKNLFRLQSLLGLSGSHPAAEGASKVDVRVSGPWQGFAPSIASGTAQLRNVRAEMRGLNTPIEIGAATVTLSSDSVQVQNISAHTGTTHWIGRVTAPRSQRCPAASADPGISLTCLYQFDLTADQLSAGDLAEWFTPHPSKRPWYRILDSDSGSGSGSNYPLNASPLLDLRARGNLHVGRFRLRKLDATQITTQMDVDRGKISLTALRGQLLQGTHQGNWVIDLSRHDASKQDVSRQEVFTQDAETRDAAHPTLHYHGSGTLQDISLEQVGTVMNDAWIAGTADGSFSLDGLGDSFRELLGRSDGRLQFVMRNGNLPHIEIPGSPAPLSVRRFAGDLSLKKGVWQVASGKLESRDGVYQVSGTVSPSNGCNLLLTRSDEQSWTLTGTLANPLVAATDRTEAKRTEAADATDTKTVKP
jgi:hypothetical protein